MGIRNNAISLTFRKDFFKDYARGQQCKIRIARLEGRQCDPPETTVLCHPTTAGIKAYGSRKFSTPDIGAAWGCMTCHAMVDGGIKTELPKDTLRLYHLEGVQRTIDALVKAGILPNP